MPRKELLDMSYRCNVKVIRYWCCTRQLSTGIEGQANAFGWSAIERMKLFLDYYLLAGGLHNYIWCLLHKLISRWHLKFSFNAFFASLQMPIGLSLMVVLRSSEFLLLHFYLCHFSHWCNFVLRFIAWDSSFHAAYFATSYSCNLV